MVHHPLQNGDRVEAGYLFVCSFVCKAVLFCHVFVPFSSKLGKILQEAILPWKLDYLHFPFWLVNYFRVYGPLILSHWFGDNAGIDCTGILLALNNFCVFYNGSSTFSFSFFVSISLEMYYVVGVWAHGDFCRINSQTGGIVMLGRRYCRILWSISFVVWLEWSWLRNNVYSFCFVQKFYSSLVAL